MSPPTADPPPAATATPQGPSPAPDGAVKEEAPPPPPALAPALACFDRGDFAGAAAAARALLANTPAPEVEAAARQLLARLAPDPWALRFGLLAAALLALVTALYAR